MDENFRDADEGLFAGAKQYKFMRALFGLVASASIGIVVTFFTKPESKERQAGLVWGTVKEAIKRYKGSEGSEDDEANTLAMPRKGEVEAEPMGDADLPVVKVSAAVLEKLRAKVGDPVYITDTRAWLGGLNSMHVRIGGLIESDADGETDVVEIGPDNFDQIVTGRRGDKPVKIERFY